MEYDARGKRGDFIGKSTDIREMFNFAHPSQVLNAVNVYSAHFYGAMLWDLYGEAAGMVYRTWNTCVKLAWDLPRSTHNYFVDQLAAPLPSVRKKLLCQFVGFCHKLSTSASWEIRILAKIAGSDIGSTTCKNLKNIQEEFNVCPWSNTASKFKREYKGYLVPPEDSWRLPLLRKLLDQRREMVTCDEDVGTITSLIDSLCFS